MFDGVSDQLHQFIASRTSLPAIPLNFPINGDTNNFPSFEPYSTTNQHLQSHLLRPLFHRVEEDGENDSNTNNLLSSTNSRLERERSVSEQMDPWSNDEVLALLRIRSSLETWFPDFTWEHVSRKLGEIGFKKSAEKCKERFEEESRLFNMNTTNIHYNNNNKNSYRLLSELEELCHGDDHKSTQNNEHIIEEEELVVEKPNEGAKNEGDEDKNVQEVIKVVDDVVLVKNEKASQSKKMKKRKFEMMKSFCESVVEKIMTQQEELHNKIIEDMVKREEGNVAREEAWRKQEMERFTKDVEIRANEQVIASDRQATINEYLKKLTFSSKDSSQNPIFLELVKNVTNSSNITPISPCLELEITQNPSFSPNQSETCEPQNPSSSTIAQVAKTPKSPSSQNDPSLPLSNSTYKVHKKPSLGSNDEEKDNGNKRWPRDEVLALINIRSNLSNTNIEDKEGSLANAYANNNNNNNKCSLWEKISQGMLELGYKRSAKRCKEKWENINKYYRKTKDNVHKKRSFDSRTCPYFHQLTTLYNKQSTSCSENRLSSPENNPSMPETASDIFPCVSKNKTNNKDGELAQSFDFDF